MSGINFFKILFILALNYNIFVVQGLSSWPLFPKSALDQNCAFLSPLPRFGLEQCLNFNLTIKTTEKNIELGDAFRYCIPSPQNHNIIQIDVSLMDNCVLKLHDGIYENVFLGREEPISVSISNFSTLIVKSCLCEDSVKLQNPSVGIIYSPYDKLPKKCGKLESNESCLYPRHVNWWNYSRPEIRRQLRLVATEYSEISIYGIGTVELSKEPPTYNTHWEDGLPIATVPSMVAEMNKKAGHHKLKIFVGAYLHDGYEPGQIQAEVHNALEAAQDAETTFPGTVSGVSIQLNVATMGHLDLIQKTLASSRTTSKSLKIGLRLENCDQGFAQLHKRSEELSTLFCKLSDKGCASFNPVQLNPTMLPLMTQAEFVICSIRPQAALFSDLLHLNLSTTEIVKNLGSTMLEIRKALKRVNPGTELILETGWPSMGWSLNGSPNSPENMKEYWVQIGDWAKSYQVKLLLFEAFDQPWKTNFQLKGKNEDGVCGAAEHYGRWRRKDNSDPGVYIEKIDLHEESPDKNYTLEQPHAFPEYCPKEESSTSIRGFIPVPVKIIAAVVFISLVSGLGFTTFRWILVRKDSRLSKKFIDIFRQGINSNDAKTLLDKIDYQVIALHFPYNKRKYELDKGVFKIDLSKSLGEGQSGTVYLGEVYKTKVTDYVGPVAFKCSNSTSTMLDIKNFLSEIKVLSYIGHHENIISLLGAYTEKLERGIVHLALEYCPWGSLDKILQSTGKFNSSEDLPECEFRQHSNYVAWKGCSDSTATAITSSSSSSSNSSSGSEAPSEQIEFDFLTMVKWCWEIANGMEHLAGKKVVHADLACRNILLTKDLTVKITDFGLAQKVYSKISPNLIFESDVVLPFRWMAPESLRKLVFSTESDVWSYGVLVWEIMCIGDAPFAGLDLSNEFVQDLEEGKRLNEPPLATDELLNLMDDCWALNPSDRPSFTKLKELLDPMLV